jgi:hypothetical protein
MGSGLVTLRLKIVVVVRTYGAERQVPRGAAPVAARLFKKARPRVNAGLRMVVDGRERVVAAAGHVERLSSHEHIFFEV